MKFIPNIFHPEKFQISKAWICNGTVLATVSWAEAEIRLKVVLLALTCGYTIHKWAAGAWRARKGKSFETEITQKED